MVEFIMKNKKAFIRNAVFVLLVGGLFAWALPRVTLTYMTRASRVGDVENQTSYVIGEKILCKADGIDKCRVNVFAADGEGLAVQGKKVLLSGLDDIKTVNNETDKFGKASFDLSSKKEGQYQISATVDGKKLSKTVTVTFKN
jgi:hypothetical protein